MSDKSLEDLLRERAKDPRAMTASLAINAGRVLLTMGAVGPLPRLVFEVKGNAFEHVNKKARQTASDASGGKDSGEGAEGAPGAALAQETATGDDADEEDRPTLVLPPAKVVPTGGVLDNPVQRREGEEPVGDPNPEAIVVQPGGEAIGFDAGNVGEAPAEPVAPPPPVDPAPPVDPSPPSRPTDPHDPVPPVPAADLGAGAPLDLGVSAQPGALPVSDGGPAIVQQPAREPVNPKDHNRAALVAMATEAGVAIDDSMTKAEIAARLNERT